MTFYRINRAVAILAAAMASVVSCTPTQEPTGPPAFALTTADVVLTEADQFPINLIFVADLDDRIWDEVTGVEVSSDVAKAPGQFEIVKGESKDGKALGNVTFNVDIPAHGLSFDSIGLVYKDAPEPVRVNVGQWHLDRLDPPNNGLSPASEEVVSIAECIEAHLPVPDEVSTVTASATNSKGVGASSFGFDAARHEISADLSCSSDSDFVIFSPTYHFTQDGGAEGEGVLPPISVGFQEIDDADFDRIAGR